MPSPGARSLGGTLCSPPAGQAGEQLQKPGPHQQLVSRRPLKQQVHHPVEQLQDLPALRGGGAGQPGQVELSLHYRRHIFPAGNVVFVPAENLRAEHHRGVVHLLAAQGLGGVQLSAVEEHQFPGLSQQIVAAAAHPHPAPLHLEQLHLVVPVAFQLSQQRGGGGLNAVTAHRQADVPVMPLFL